MSELNRLLTKTENAIASQIGARAAFTELKAFLLDDYVEELEEETPPYFSSESAEIGSDLDDEAD